MSAAVLGAGVGSAIGGWLSDKVGRKKALLLGDALFTAGALLMAAATTPKALIAGMYCNTRDVLLQELAVDEHSVLADVMCTSMILSNTTEIFEWIPDQDLTAQTFSGGITRAIAPSRLGCRRGHPLENSAFEVFQGSEAPF